MEFVAKNKNFILLGSLVIGLAGGAHYSSDTATATASANTMSGSIPGITVERDNSAALSGSGSTVLVPAMDDDQE